MKLYPTAH